MRLRVKSQIPDPVAMGKMTLNFEADSCSISCDVEKLLEAVVSGVRPEQTHSNHPAGFGALKYDVRHAALVELQKTRPSVNRTKVRMIQI